MNLSIHDVGRVIARALGTGPARSTIVARRQAVLAAMLTEADRSGAAVWKSRWVLGLAAAGLGVLLVAVLLVKPTGEGELSAKLGSRLLPQESEVSASTRQVIEFTDGSHLSLEPAARIELSELSTSRARIELREGQLSASIRKGTGRTWTISAGPFEVRVVGTQLEVRWNHELQKFGVSVTEGKILVFGRDLPPAGLPLEAGGRFERQLSPAAVESPADDAVPTAAVASAPALASHATPKAEARSISTEADWSKLANEGQYKRALELADRAGFERLTRELGANDLLLLANTARFAGDFARARVALLALRQRFPRGSAAPLSALYLAQIAETRDKNPAEVARWLSTFLNESPNGGLAADARARLLSILLKQGDRARARAVAADYLKFHPDGTYAEKARNVIDASH
jgi:TolA-binding protein